MKFTNGFGRFGLFLACLLGSLLASQAMAVEWSANSHKLLKGDYNGDGVGDFYLATRPLPMVLPLNGITPLIVLRSQHDVVLIGDLHGGYTAVAPPDANILKQVAWVEADYSILTADFNGDGINDLLLRPDVSGRDGLLLTRNSAGIPSVAQVLNSLQLGVELSKDGGYQLQWIDVNADGKADLLLTKVGVGNQALLAAANGFAPAKSIATPVDDQPLVANAWGIAEGGGQVSLDGRYTYNLPLEIPVGINALQPNLTVSYQMYGQDGYMGQGWGLSGLHSIHRCAATIAQDQYNGAPSGSGADKLCLDGQRLQLVSGAQFEPGSTYRAEQDSFAKITLMGSSGNLYFEMRERNGWISTLGKTVASRLIPLDSTQPMAWQLDSISDRFDNQLTVTYSKTGGVLLPVEINYGGNRVEFTYRARVNGPVQLALGGELKLDKLLERVATYAPGGKQLREYRLGYAYSQNSGQPRISYAQSCGVTARGALECLAANTFTYGAQPNNLADAGLLAASKPPSGALLSVEASIDWNGDGINDLLTVNFDAIYVALGSSKGLGSNLKIAAPPVNSAFLTATPVDVDADGKHEVLYLSAAKGTPQQLTWAYINESGVTKTVTSWSVANISSALTNFAGSLTSTTNVFMTAAKAVAFDFSHDGYSDLLLPVNGEWRLYQNKPGSAGTFSDSGRMSGVTVSATDAPWFAPFSLEGDGKWQLLTTQIKSGVQYFSLLPLARQGNVSAAQKIDLSIPVNQAVVLDVNGDGLQDFAVPNAAKQLVLYLNKGGPVGASNFKSVVTNMASTGIFSGVGIRRDNEDYIPKPIDYDGDGRQDLLYINTATQRYEVLRSTGGGFEAAGVNAPVSMGPESYNASKKGCADYPARRAKMVATIATAPVQLKALYQAILTNNDVVCEYIPAGPLTASTDSLIGDWNGDGQEDLLLAAKNNSQIVWRFYQQSRMHAEWLTQVTDSLGNLTQVAVKPLSDSSVYQGGQCDAISHAELAWAALRRQQSEAKRWCGRAERNSLRIPRRAHQSVGPRFSRLCPGHK